MRSLLLLLLFCAGVLGWSIVAATGLGAIPAVGDVMTCESGVCSMSNESVLAKFDYEIRDVRTAKEGSLADFRTSPEVVASYVALQDTILQLHDHGYLQEGATLKLHYARIFAHQSEGATVWPPEKVEGSLTSPWIQVRRNTQSNVENKTEIHLLASDLRLISDLYAWRDGLNPQSLVTRMPVIPQSCLETAVEQYVEAATTAQNISVDTGFFQGLKCSPASLDEPLIHFFEIAPSTFRAPFLNTVFYTLDVCRTQYREFYSDLYAALIVRALSVLSNVGSLHESWWLDAISSLDMAKCDGAPSD